MRIFKKQKEIQDSANPAVEHLSSRKTLTAKRKTSKSDEKLIQKPLSRHGRVFILVFLLILSVTSGILAIVARNGKLPGLPRLPILTGKFEETVILGDDKAVVKDDVRTREAISAWRERTNELSGIYAFYVVRLKDSTSYGVAQLDEMQAASLIKLPVMAALLKEVEEGGILLSSKYTLKDSDKIGGSGSLSSRPAGTTVSFEELLTLMGKQSDNTAYNIVLKRLGETKVTGVMREFGMISTSIGENITTPSDVGNFFKVLWKGGVISKDSRDMLLASLTDTIYENWLRVGVPENVRVAHKYGREVHVVNDAGVIYTKDPFVLVIMTQGVIEKEADEVFPELTSLIYGIETGERL